MRCPACGHENSNLATRCASCGAMLPTNIEADKTDEREITGNHHAPGGTAERLATPLDAPPPAVEGDPKFREVAGTAGKFVRGKGARIGSFFSSHQRVLGIGLAVGVLVVFGITWLVINLFDAPTYRKIEADLTDRMGSFEYAGGTYGPDLQIPLSSVAVTKRSSTKTPEGMQVSGGVGPTAFDVEAEATFDDGTIRVVRDVGATYVRGNGEWALTGELSEQGTSYSARAGVDENKVLANMETILNAAGAQTGTSLAAIYANGSFSIVGNSFKEAGNKDTATDEVTIHCTRESGFYSYEGNVRAIFSFESGVWALRSAEADEQATTRSYDPLVGTWSGELVSTTSDGSNCYGAQGYSLVVSIDTVGDPSNGRGQVQGTVSAMAHYHERLESDQTTNSGDTLLERQSFTGTIDSSLDEDEENGLTVECSTTGSPDGDLEFTLVFGTDDDPSTVLAYVTSTHTYEESFLLFIPYQTTAEFTDTYLLSKS